jgi:ATP-dependent DNA helicase RecG
MAARLHSYERSSETDVILVLPGGKANRDFVRLVVEENQAGRPFRLDDLLLLNHVYLERRTTAKEAAKIIQKPENEARAALERLVEGGLLDASGEGKARAYHLCASTYRRLGERADYIRTHGFEPFQWEQMVLQYMWKSTGKYHGLKLHSCAIYRGRRPTDCLRSWWGKGTSLRLGQRDEA